MSAAPSVPAAFGAFSSCSARYTSTFSVWRNGSTACSSRRRAAPRRSRFCPFGGDPMTNRGDQAWLDGGCNSVLWKTCGKPRGWTSAQGTQHRRCSERLRKASRRCLYRTWCHYQRAERRGGRCRSCEAVLGRAGSGGQRAVTRLGVPPPALLWPRQPLIERIQREHQHMPAIRAPENLPRNPAARRPAQA